MVSCDGDVMSSLIFPHSVRLNTEAYIKCLEEVVLAWIEWVAAGWLSSGKGRLRQATQAIREPNVGSKKISETH